MFLTRFNEESKRVALMSKIAGVTTIGKSRERSRPLPTKGMLPTVMPEPTQEPSPTEILKRILEIKLGEMEIVGQRVEIKVKREVEEFEQIPNSNSKFPNDSYKIPWQVFDLKLIFSENVKPGSSDNKFIFKNKEYEVKILNKKGDVLNSFMYKIFDDSIIINPEGGIWGGNAEYGVGVYSDGAKVSEVKFATE
jgi:hypothetical protein